MSDGRDDSGWPASEGAPLPPPPPPGYGAPPPGVSDPYGASPAGAYGYGGHTTKTGTNGLAIASLCCSIGGIVLGAATCGILAPAIIVGIVLGHVALSQIKSTGQEGRGLALGGIITGYAVIGLTILVIVLAVAFGDTSSST
jgi:hypothetical protein